MRKQLTAAVAALAVLVPATSAMATPLVTVESPADGATFSQTQESFLAGGDVTFDEPLQETRRFYLHRQTCQQSVGGPSGGGRSLSLDNPGTDLEDPCPFNVHQWTPLGMALNGADQYTAEDGLGLLTLDASSPITGVLTVQSFPVAGTHVGGGTGTIEIGIRTVSSSVIQLATTVEYESLPGDGPQQIPWSVSLDPELDKLDTRDPLELTVRVMGVNALHGFTVYNGASYMDVPVWTNSFNRRVELSVDGEPFSTAGVSLAPELDNWTAEVPIPPLPPEVPEEEHTLRVRAVQGSFEPNISPVMTRQFRVVE